MGSFDVVEEDEEAAGVLSSFLESAALGVPGGVFLLLEAPDPPPIESDLAAAGFEPPMDSETALASPDGGGSVILADEGCGAG